MVLSERTGRRAFALTELLGAVVILVVALAVCALVLPDARRRARLAGSLHNLQQIGAIAHAYAIDNEDRVFSYSWAPGVHSCGGEEFPQTAAYHDAAAQQAVCIMRRRAERPDISVITAWLPHILYNHLPLVDYANDRLPSSIWVSPGDAPRMAWIRADQSSSDPAERAQAYLDLVCRPAGVGNSDLRWPYSASYEVQPSFFSPEAQVNTPQGPIPTVAQDPVGHRYFQTGNTQTVLGNRFMHEVWFPSNKAMVYESAQRFFGREVYFMSPEARVPVLCADGGAAVRSINRANRGFQPNAPLSQAPTRVLYVRERAWEPPTTNDIESEFYDGVIRWTRSGLRGRDFGGPEVPWVP